MENTTIADSILVAQISDERAKLMIPVVIYICLLMVSGLLGNSMVIVFYGFVSKMTSNTFFIVVLTLFDIVASCVTMPNEIADVIKYFTYESSVACRVLTFINYVIATGSTLTLAAIAIDRYNIIYRLSLSQITIPRAKKISVAIMVVSVILSWPALIFYTTVQRHLHNKHNRTLYGTECSTTKDLAYRTYILLFNGIQFLLLLVLATCICFLYSRVGRVLYRHRKALLRHYRRNTTESSLSNHLQMRDFSTNQTVIQVCGNERRVESFCEKDLPEASENNLADSADQCKDEIHQNNEHEKNIEEDFKLRDVHDTTDKGLGSANNSKIDIESLKVTFVMIVVTALLIISFVPYICITVWFNTISAEEKESISGTKLVVLELSLRSYLLNSGLNPWVYGILNSAFREYFLTKCFRTCHN